MIIRTTKCWTTQCDFDDIPSLIRAALEWERLTSRAFSAEERAQDYAATQEPLQPAHNDLTSPHIAEWARHAGSLLYHARKDNIRSFDIAIVTHSMEQYGTLISEQCLFDDGLLSDADFLSDMDRLVHGGNGRFSVTFTVVKPDISDQSGGYLEATIDLASGLTMNGVCLSSGEWTHMWAEAEWL